MLKIRKISLHLLKIEENIAAAAENDVNITAVAKNDRNISASAEKKRKYYCRC